MHIICKFTPVYPDSFLDSLFQLRYGRCSVAVVLHFKPLGAFYPEEIVPVVGVVGVAEMPAYGHLIQSALLFNLSYCAGPYILSGLLFAFWEVPSAMPEDYEVFSLFVCDKSASCVYLCEVGEELFEC